MSIRDAVFCGTSLIPASVPRDRIDTITSDLLDDFRCPAMYSGASVLIPKSISFYAFAPMVRRQKRWMLARMSSAVLVQRKGFGLAFVASM